MLNPVQRRFPQLGHRLLGIVIELDLMQPAPRKEARQLPAASPEWPHPGMSALLAIQSRRLPKMKSLAVTKNRSAVPTAFQRRQVPAQLYRPERKVSQGQLPRRAPLHFSGDQKKQPKHRLRD